MRTAKFSFSPIQAIGVLLVYLAVFSNAPLYGQSLASYQKKESQKIDSTLLNLKEKNGLQILSLAPSMSYSKVTGVNVGINLGSIVSYAQTKRRNRIESAKLESQLKAHLETQINDAAEQEISILDEYEIQLLELDILSSKRELFVLDRMKYENQEITFSEFTSTKISYHIAWKTAYVAIKKLSLNIERFFNKYGYRPTEIESLMKTAKSYEIKS